MRLLLRHSDKRQRVENGLALDFQFSREIVDSNLTHPAFRFPALGLHCDLTESAFCTRTFSNMYARAMVIRLFREQNLAAHALFLLTQLQRPRIHQGPLRLLPPPLQRQPLPSPLRFPRELLPRPLQVQQELLLRPQPRLPQTHPRGWQNNYSPLD